MLLVQQLVFQINLHIFQYKHFTICLIVKKKINFNIAMMKKIPFGNVRTGSSSFKPIFQSSKNYFIWKEFFVLSFFWLKIV